MTDDCISLGPCAPELCRTDARCAAEKAVWAARRRFRWAFSPANIVENATRAAYAVLEPWFIEHADDFCVLDDYAPAPPNVLFQSAVNAAAHQLYR